MKNNCMPIKITKHTNCAKKPNLEKKDKSLSYFEKLAKRLEIKS